MISGAKFPEGKNKETGAETTEKVKKLLTDSLHIDLTELNNEIKWQTNRNKLRKHQHQTLHASLKLIATEKHFSLRKISYTIIATRKSKYRSDLLEKAQNHIWNLQGIKFCFADPNGNLEVKFKDNKNMNFDSLESLGNVIERKLGIRKLSNWSIKKMYHQYDTDTDDIDGGGD